jgi:pyruvate dehydrogenase E2 component (dihydrolipoamide acetyltransferase)
VVAHVLQKPFHVVRKEIVMEFVMPKLDHTMEEGIIVEWYAKEGDPIEKGSLLVAVETNKCILDVESPVSGILTRIIAPQGETVPLFGLLAIIE